MLRPYIVAIVATVIVAIAIVATAIVVMVAIAGDRPGDIHLVAGVQRNRA